MILYYTRRLVTLALKHAAQKFPYLLTYLLCISAAYAIMWCLSVSDTFVDHVKMNKHVFIFFSPSGSYTFQFFHTKRHGNIPMGTPLTGVSSAGGVGRNRDFEPISGFSAQCLLLMLQQTRCCQHGRRWTTATVLQINCDTSLAESGGVDCGRRRQNVYDKKPQCYSKDNRTAHLTACINLCN